MTASKDPDELGNEIDAALDGVNLQEVDMTTRKAGKGSPQLYPGTIVGVNGDDVFVELGPRMQGVINASEFDDPPEVGQRFDFNLRGKDDDLMLLSLREAQAIAKWNEMEPGAVVSARVTGQNTGGLELAIGPLTAFMPASQAAMRHVEDLSSYIGQTMLCEVLEVDQGRKRVLVSRRKVLEREQADAREQAMGRLHVGQVLKGKVSRVESFGGFVDLGGGIEGLVHVSNISRRRVENAAEHLAKGQEVEVKVLEIKEGGKRIGLGMKQLEPDPWDGVADRLRVDSLHTGKVVRLADFGAFVELEPGLDGLIHISQFGPGRPGRVQEVCKVGDELSVRILAVDPHQRRLSLTRLDKRGALIGSEEAIDDSDLDRIIGEQQTGGLGTNLGSLFKKALEDPK